MLLKLLTILSFFSICLHANQTTQDYENQIDTVLKILQECHPNPFTKISQEFKPSTIMQRVARLI